MTPWNSGESPLEGKMIKKIDHTLTKKLSDELRKRKSSSKPMVWSYVYLKTGKDGNAYVDDRKLIMSLDYGSRTPSVILESGFSGAKLWDNRAVKKWAAIYLKQRKLMFDNFKAIDKIDSINRAADERRDQERIDMVEYGCKHIQQMAGRASVS